MPPDAMDPTLPKAPLEIGSTFAGYQIRALIGRGGHACVYRAYDEFLDKHFALKVLYRAGGVTPEMMKRGRAEAQFLSSFRHPHVVEVGRAGIENGFMFIQMELLEGRALRIVQELAGRLEVEEVLLIAQQIAEGVAVAHQHKAIHRDLKPDNVFICTGNLSKVLDFGIAKLVGQGGWTTQRNLVVGTMLYMSPEQVQGMPVGPESDVYALGLIMFTLLFGRHPCLLDMESVSNDELARIQVMRVPPQLDEIAPHIPIYVGRLVAKALVKLPEERIRSMSDFAAMIRTVRERYITDLRKAGRVPQSRDLSSCDFGRDFEVSLAGRRAPSVGGTDTIAVSRPLFSQPLGPGEAGATLPLPGGSPRSPAARSQHAAVPGTAEYGSPPSRPAPIKAAPVSPRVERAPTSADKATLMAVEGPSGHLVSPPDAPQVPAIPVRNIVFESPKKSRATPTPSPTSLGRTGSPVGAPTAPTRRFHQLLAPYRQALVIATVAGAGLGVGLAVVHAVRRGGTADVVAPASTLIVEPLPDLPSPAAPPPTVGSPTVATPVASPSAVVAEVPSAPAPAAATAEPAPKPSVVPRPTAAKSAKVDPVLESMKATAQRFREEAARVHQSSAAPTTSAPRRATTSAPPKSRLPFPDSGL